ncbi:MAG: phosphatase PAP2 family protein [Terriglobales bacterium]
MHNPALADQCCLPHSYSFPSGHSLFSFCIYGVLAGLLTARIRSGALRAVIWLLAAGLITAIGTSRIYLGVHYPSDVIAGYLAAAMLVSTLIAADRMRKRKRMRDMRVPSP